MLNLPASFRRLPEVWMRGLPEFHQRDLTAPDLRSKDLRTGFSIDLWLQLDSLASGQRVLDSRDSDGRGIHLSTTDAGTLKLTMNDGRSESSWDTDRSAIRPGKLHHLVVIVDGGPKIITCVVDGILCDGGDDRQFGWGRFSPTLQVPNGSSTLRIAPTMQGAVRSLRLYSRALRTSEAVGNFGAGPEAQSQ